MLLAWSETHSGGAKVTFLLPDAESLEPFKAMTVAKGKTAGQRLALVAVEIGDDEQPVNQCDSTILKPSNSGELKLKGGDLAKLAGVLCANPDFLEWGDFSNESIAADWIRTTCGVSSRAELDHNPEAAQKFHRLVRIPFVEREQ